MNSTSMQHLDPTAHVHTPRCWWDHREARWVCGPAADSVDIRDMIVVHTALLREFRLAPAAVRRVPPGDRRSAATVDAHLDLLCGLLHHHHASEDELLWPQLSPRLSDGQRDLVDVAEAQHAGIEQALGAVQQARGDWRRDVDTTTATELAAHLRTLHQLLSEHLEVEERDLLPLASAYLTDAEWAAVGAAGAAGVPKSAMLLVFGMFAYEGDPAVLAAMLHSAPRPARFVVPRLAPRAYARHALKVHGTARP